LRPERKSKVALVTGAAAGLGRAIAERLIAEGSRVIITDISSKIGPDTAQAIGASFLHQDVRDERRWQEVVATVEGQYGRLDVLVNNAGIAGAMDAVGPEHTRLTDWKDIFAVNVEGVFLGCKTAIPAMRRSGAGSIINISSVAALTATPYATAYGASKAAVRQLTKSVAQYCAEQRLGIRCNSVHPDVVRTSLWESYAAESAARGGISVEEFAAREKAQIPMGEFIEPQDVAAAVWFLASEESRFITGAYFPVDGGVVHCDTFRG